MSMDLLKMFEDAKTNEEKAAEKRQESTSFVNEDEIYFKTGSFTFRFRLIFALDPKKTKRRKPFFGVQKHVFWDEAAQERHEVICPTSDYLLDKGGFKQCVMCAHASKAYKENEKTGSQLAKDLYDQYKRNFAGYVMVYVINDPVNPDNNGTFKVMRMGFTIFNFLKEQIWGLDKKDNQVDDSIEVMGIDAFKLKKGYDLIVTTSKKTDKYNEYKCSWSRKATDVPISDEDCLKAVEELKFDEKYYKDWDQDAILEFEKVVIANQSEPEVDIEISDDDDDDIPMGAAVPSDNDSSEEENIVEENESDTEDEEMDINDEDIDKLFED